jgi:hypothetical protein
LILPRLSNREIPPGHRLLSTCGGVIAIANPIKLTTPAALDSLRTYVIKIVMLTGDNRTTTAAVVRKLGIQEVEADFLPQYKNRIVKRRTAEGRIVAMAGDGVTTPRRWPSPLSAPDGNRHRVKIQERYGIAKDQVRKDVDTWYESQKW